jgi:imidazole glycerol-phosphate synthase subunit HisH
LAKAKVVIIERKSANIISLKNAINNVCDCNLSVSSELKIIRESDFIILPGVGAFGDGMDDLIEQGLVEELKHQALEIKKPFLGICLGMQLLFEQSYEGGFQKGLGLIPGEVKILDLDHGYRIPHVGWNNITFSEEVRIFDNLVNDKNFYFVHSYYADCDKKYVIAEADYGKYFTAAVQKENILGFQFHPEKSQSNGMILLNNFFNNEYY